MKAPNEVYRWEGCGSWPRCVAPPPSTHTNQPPTIVAGEAGYGESFIETWLAAALYVDAPLAVLVPVYLGWAALSLALWWLVPPRSPERR